MIIDLLHSLIRYHYHRNGFSSHYLDLDSCRLHFFRRDNPNASRHLVFIHGLGTSSSTWIKILPSLSRSDAISFIDLPGHGFSKITTDNSFFLLEQFDKSLVQWFEQNKKLPITLIGHSLGGWIAARFAIQNPGSVEHLVLINNAGIRYRGIEHQAEIFSVNNVSDVKRLLDQMWLHYPWYFRPFTSSIYRSMQKKQISKFVAAITEKDVLNATFSTLTIPVDVIWGFDDKFISRKSVDVMKLLLPHIQIQFIQNCGHVPQLERPRELAFLLNRILTPGN